MNQQATSISTLDLPSNPIAALHDRLLEKNADYRALVALQDTRLEAVLAKLEAPGLALDDYQSLTGELRGLRAARGASTVKRGQK